MKRIGFIYEKIYDKKNIELAIYNASKRKKRRKDVQRVLADKQKYINKIHLELKERTYQTKPYRIKTIKDNSSTKVREIAIPNFYDLVVQWCIMQVLEPIFKPKFYEWSTSCVKGKGVGAGVKYVSRVLKRDFKNTKYCLKIDIKKYYQNIPKELLKQKLARHIKDNDALNILSIIIDSNKNGLPIGNYTSQFLANFFLTDIDNYIKKDLKIKYYTRYMDDFVMFGNNKKELHRKRKLLFEKLESQGLTVKENWQLFRTDSRPIDFLGFKFYRNYKTLRRRTFLRIKRRVKRTHKKNNITPKFARAMMSYYGRIKQTNYSTFWRKHIKPYINYKKLKEIIRYDNRKNTYSRTTENALV